MVQEIQNQEEAPRPRGRYPRPVRTRVSVADYERLAEAADVAGMSIGGYARHRLAGAHVSSKVEVMVLNELRRIGGLLKMLATKGEPTGLALDELKRAMKTLQEQ